MAVVPITNPDFTSDASGWTLRADSPAVLAWSSTGGSSTPGCIKYSLGSKHPVDIAAGITSGTYPCTPGKSITANCMIALEAGNPGMHGQIALVWEDANGTHLGNALGTLLYRYAVGSGYNVSSVTATVPPGAVNVRIEIAIGAQYSGSVIYVDNVTWNNEAEAATLAYPLSGAEYAVEAPVPFRIYSMGSVGISSVEYFAENTSTATEVSVGVSSAAPWGVNYSELEEGSYIARAEINLAGGGKIDTNTVPFVISEDPQPPGELQEFRASNAYTYFIAKNFAGIAGSMPPTAQVVGARVILDYSIQALVRSKDVDIEDAASSQYEAAFAIAPSVSFEAALLTDNTTSYTQVGTAMIGQADVAISDFTVSEDSTSEGMRFTVLDGSPQTVVIGGEDALFGTDFIPASEFVTKALGVRFFPNLELKPEYADKGDACYRVKIDKVRLQVYFDAGSIEYYFASPGYGNVIKGELVAGYADTGRFENGDAAGILQLTSNLVSVEGSAEYIDSGWTIHAAYPPSTSNQIGVVAQTMSYNGLPVSSQLDAVNSRMQFISANFYGDLTYDSIYGVSGAGRAFAYNGDWFYKIHAHPSEEKDKPRHVEYYHTHLALGYKEGRVDISVVGEPYNFDGADGASSWAIGDSVTGLSILSGTMLGVFGRKSIHGIAGTTVDNFATQVLSPKVGAIEYTVADMGFPVYANTYGIYTLAQTASYGDYLGTPMSQDVSPWLRPRLTSNRANPKGVVCSWPVRAKNQYKLAFSDGYVLTMTVNNGLQEAPTFSKQLYAIGGEALVPGAISSELDHNGEERIHVTGRLAQLPPSVLAAQYTLCSSEDR